jgi:hypothetical protein
MVTSYLINGGLAFVMLVTYCYVLADYTAAEESAVGAIGLPFIQVFVNATGSLHGGTALVAVLVVIQSFGCINWMASTARQVFAFARDQGLPVCGTCSRLLCFQQATDLHPPVRPLGRQSRHGRHIPHQLPPRRLGLRGPHLPHHPQLNRGLRRHHFPPNPGLDLHLPALAQLPDLAPTVRCPLAAGQVVTRCCGAPD